MTLVYMVIAWSAGIVFASAAGTIGLAGPGLAVAGIILAALARRDMLWRQIGLCTLAAGLGAWRFDAVQPHFTDADLATYNDQGFAEMIGVVTAEPDVRDNDVQLRVEMQSIQPDQQPKREVHGLALVYADRFSGFTYGDRLRIRGTPTTPPTFDTFSYRDYLARGGVYTLVRYGQITLLEHDQGSPILAALFDIKERSHQLITRLLPSPQSALLTGILLGNDNDIPPEVASAFNQTGTTHIIAISGSNITIIAGLLFVLFGRLKSKWLGAFAMLVGIGVYTIFVGATASVVRAAIMGSLAILALRFGRRSDGLTALAASVWFMTMLNPATLFDVGLILSCAATLGLVLYTQPLTRLVERIASRLFAADTARQVTAAASDAVLITFAAQITTLPVIFLVFGRFSAISFLVNMLVIPAQAPIMSLGILSVVIGAIWLPLGQLLAWLVNIPVAYTLAVIRAAAQLPGASVPITLEPTVFVGYYVVLFGATAVLARPPDERQAWLARLRQAAMTPAVGILGLALAVLLWATALSRPDGRLHVWFLAVGQGNAVLIQTPRGAHLLVDGGENPTQLRTAIGDRLPFYQRDLDALFVTQPKPGTIAALPPLFDRYNVRTVISSGLAGKDETYRALLDKIGSSGAQTIVATTGYRLQTDDGVTIDVLNPPGKPGPTDNPDDAALVLRLTYGDATFLLTSELSPQRVESLLASRQYLRAAVLLLPSNGREKPNTDAWLAAIGPQVAVVEAEAGSRTALPAPHVLDYLGAKQIPVYRTDMQGTIEIASDGQQLWISTASSR
jgi:competence protein ComEC